MPQSLAVACGNPQENPRFKRAYLWAIARVEVAKVAVLSDFAAADLPQHSRVAFR